MHAQATIRFKKDATLIYFFQKGPASDTLAKNPPPLFYLLVPDSLKEYIAITVENGRLRTTANDSLVQLEVMRGLNYESLYLLKEGAAMPPAGYKQKKPARELKSMINGTAPADHPNRITIRITNRREDKAVLENVFYYRE